MSSQNVTRKLPAVTLPAAPFSSAPSGWTRTVFTAGLHEFTPKPETTLMYVVAVGGGGGGYAENDSSSIGLDGGETKVVSAQHGIELLRVLGGAGATASARGVAAKLDQEARSGWLSNVVQPNVTSGTNGSTTNQNAATGGNSNGDGGASFVLPSKGETGTNNNSPIANFNLSRSWPGPAGTTPRTATKKMLAGSKITFNYTATNVNTTVYFRFLVNGVVVHNRQNTASYTGSYTHTIPSDGDYTFTWELYQSYQLVVSGTANLSVSSVAVTGNNNIIYYPITRGGAGGDYAHAAFLPELLTLHVGAGGVGSGSNFAVPTTALGFDYGGGGTAGRDGASGAVIIFEYSTALPEEPLDSYELSRFDVSGHPVGALKTAYYGGAVGSIRTVRHYVRPTTKTVIALLVGGGGGHNANFGNVAVKAPSAKLIAENFQIVATGGTANKANTYTYWDSRCSYNSTTQTWTGCNRTGYNYTQGIGGVYDSELPALIKRENVPNSGTALPNIGLVNSYGQGAAKVSGSFHHGGDGAYALVSFGGFEDQQYFDLEIPGGGAGDNGNGYPGVIYIFEAESWTGFTTQTILDILQNSPLGANNVTQNALLILEDRGEAPNNVTQNSMLVTHKLGNAVTQISESRVDVAYADDVSPIRTTATTQGLLLEAETPKIRASASVENILLESDVPKILTSTSIEGLLVESPISALRSSASLAGLLIQSDPGAIRTSTSVSAILTEDADPTVMPSQNTKLVLLRLNKTIIYLMDFGVVRYPEKGKLYDSLECVVEGVETVITLQLEGYLPAGSTIFLNGEDVGRSVVAKNGDIIQLRSGTTNWYDSRVTLYGYVTREDQIIREYAGFWTMLQADLSAAKHAWLGILALYTGVLKSVTRPFPIQYKMAKSVANANLIKQTPSRLIAGVKSVQTIPTKQHADIFTVQTAPVIVESKTAEFSYSNEVSDYHSAGYDFGSIDSKAKSFTVQRSIVGTSELSVASGVALVPIPQLKHTETWSVIPDVAKVKADAVSTSQAKVEYKAAAVDASYKQPATAKIPVMFLLFGIQTKAAYAKKEFKAFKEFAQKVLGVYHRFRLDFGVTSVNGYPNGYKKSHVGQFGVKLPDFYSVSDNFRTWAAEFVGQVGAQEVADSKPIGLGNSMRLVAPGVERQIYGVTLSDFYPILRKYAEVSIRLAPVLRTTPRVEFTLDDFIRNSTNAEQFTLLDFDVAKTIVVKVNTLMTSFAPTNYQGEQWGFAYRPDKEHLPVDQSYGWTGTRTVALGGTGYVNGSAHSTSDSDYGWVFFEARNAEKVQAVFKHMTPTSTAVKQIFRKTSANTVYTRYSTVPQHHNRTLIPIGYALAKTNVAPVRVTPINGQPGKNRISSAKYYMGFSTKTEVEEFTKNFFAPTFRNKLDGYVYRVGTNDTLVCEVRGANMPIAWLMHGG